MSFKIDSHAVAELPAPKPYREIWVASPQVEGVHLRFGAVARGGLRWSDRRDDFRTEVLDLVKAQQVKNAIIVPVGAKGGFFPKRPCPRAARPVSRKPASKPTRPSCAVLLDITDNIKGDEIVPPTRRGSVGTTTIAYLVVAADKGTATFSDIANGISADYGHWLGDAFASGGSVGYDHKAMGITAKGAWEAVKRHFREIGKRHPERRVHCHRRRRHVGRCVRQRHVALAQDPAARRVRSPRYLHRSQSGRIAKRASIERKRLFDTPRTSWQDYDKKLISKGGGVFSRSAKSIDVSPEIAAITGIDKPSVTPIELMSALLKASAN